MTIARISGLEARWLAALQQLSQYDSPANIADEAAAYDAYADACDELDLCLQAGCWVRSPDHAYCPPHRVSS